MKFIITRKDKSQNDDDNEPNAKGMGKINATQKGRILDINVI